MSISDPLEMPLYSVPLAAHYLRLPVQTLRRWCTGQRSGNRPMRAVLTLPDATVPLLSFNNLAEAHVLGALRHSHNVPLQSIRRAVNYISKKFGTRHPLIQHEFQTDGVSLFVEHLGDVINASESGQIMIREFIELSLTRLVREGSHAIGLFPFTRAQPRLDSPRAVLINPRISFGQPVLEKFGIPTGVLAERFQAGDSIEDLAEDYGCPPNEVEESIRYELNYHWAA